MMTGFPKSLSGAGLPLIYNQFISNAAQGACLYTNPCVAEAECYIPGNAQIIGEPACECPTGYTGDGLKGEGFSGCMDVDECFLHIDQCHANEYCLNTEGGYMCPCRPGYAADNGECYDINECEGQEGQLCQSLGLQCINFDGDWDCLCGDIDTEKFNKLSGTCEDKDKCDVHSAHYPCDRRNGTCNIEDAVPACGCEIGFELQVDLTCTDIDECSDPGLNECDSHSSQCHNTYGSYECICNRGYRLVSDFACEDINECESAFSCGVLECCINLETNVAPDGFACAPSFRQIQISQSSFLGWPIFVADDPGHHIEMLDTSDINTLVELGVSKVKGAKQLGHLRRLEPQEPHIDWEALESLPQYLNSSPLNIQTLNAVFTDALQAQQWAPGTATAGKTGSMLFFGSMGANLASQVVNDALGLRKENAKSLLGLKLGGTGFAQCPADYVLSNIQAAQNLSSALSNGASQLGQVISSADPKAVSDGLAYNVDKVFGELSSYVDLGKEAKDAVLTSAVDNTPSFNPAKLAQTGQQLMSLLTKFSS